jgi:hypothetical protein
MNQLRIAQNLPKHYFFYLEVFLFHYHNCIAGRRYRGRCSRNRHSGIRHISPKYRSRYSGNGLGPLILAPEWFWNGTRLTGCRTVRHSGISLILLNGCFKEPIRADYKPLRSVQQETMADRLHLGFCVSDSKSCFSSATTTTNKNNQ